MPLTNERAFGGVHVVDEEKNKREHSADSRGQDDAHERHDDEELTNRQVGWHGVEEFSHDRPSFGQY